MTTSENIPKYWNSRLFDSVSCSGQVLSEGQGDFLVRGTVKQANPNGIVKFFASSPPDHRTSYAGSGLPFANPEMAYESTPNKGAVRASNGDFQFKVVYPNAFYVDQGKTLLPPHVLIKVCDEHHEETQAIVLGDKIPHRTLTSNTYVRSRNNLQTYPNPEYVNPDYN